jgi:hypothetical protein
MAVKLKPLLLEHLISAPLRALVVGQQAATQATADVISGLGFVAGTAGRPATARTFEFEYSHPVPDPDNPGSTIDTPTRVRVPLLTLLPVQNLRISEAQVSFGADVIGVTTVRMAGHVLVSDSDRASVKSAATRLVATYAPSTVSPGQPAPTLTVTIKVVGEQPAEGLARVLSVLGDAMTASAAKPGSPPRRAR